MTDQELLVSYLWNDLSLEDALREGRLQVDEIDSRLEGVDLVFEGSLQWVVSLAEPRVVNGDVEPFPGQELYRTRRLHEVEIRQAGGKAPWKMPKEVELIIIEKGLVVPYCPFRLEPPSSVELNLANGQRLAIDPFMGFDLPQGSLMKSNLS